MATTEEFRAIFGVDPPPGATFDGPPTAGPPPQTPASQSLPADRPATDDERNAILGTPAPVIPAPRPASILGTSLRTNGAGGAEPEVWNNEARPEQWGGVTPDTWGNSPELLGVTPQGANEAIGAIKGAITGDTSVARPDVGPLSIPGLGLGGGPNASFWSRVGSNATDPRALAILGQSMLSRDPKALEAVIKRNIPDAQFSNDEQGNRIVQVGNNPPMYLDRPGVTPQKSLFYAPQTAAAVLSGGKTIPGMIARGAAQEELSNVGSHMLGGAPGWVDPEALLTGAGLTAALGVTGKVLGPALNWFIGGNEATSTATRRTIAEEFGHEPTLGQVSGNPYQLKKEDLLLNAKAAPDQSSRLVDLHRGNLTATNNAKSGLIAEASGATPLTPGKPPVTPQGFQGDEGTLGDQMLGNIRGRYEALSDAEKQAWDKLGPVSPNTPGGQSVAFTDRTAADITGRAYKEVSDGLGLPTGPNGQYSAADLRNGGQSVVDALNVITDRTMGVTPAGTPTTVGFNLGHLQDVRQKLQNIIDSAPNPSVARIVRRMKAGVDGAVSDAEANGQLIGNPQALTDFRTANQATRDKYNFVAPNKNPAAADFMEAATRKIDTPAGPRYAMGGQDAVDKSLGAGNVVEPGGGTSDILTHLQGQLGPNSDALNAARGVVVKRPLYGRNVSPAEPGTEATTGAGYGSTAKRLDAQLSGPGSQVSSMLLDPAAQMRLSRFKDALDTLNRSYTPSSPRLNPSGSGYLFSGASRLPIPNFMQDAIQRLGASASINTAIKGGQRPVLAFPAAPLSPMVAPVARVGGLLGYGYGP